MVIRDSVAGPMDTSVGAAGYVEPYAHRALIRLPVTSLSIMGKRG
jgi:hypothetical protein